HYTYFVYTYALRTAIHFLRRPPLPVFFLMFPPPPRSTLFPYTTLFRSKVAGGNMCARSKLTQGNALISAESTQCQSQCFTQQWLGMTNSSTVRRRSRLGSSGFFEECSCSVHY